MGKVYFAQYQEGNRRPTFSMICETGQECRLTGREYVQMIAKTAIPLYEVDLPSEHGGQMKKCLMWALFDANEEGSVQPIDQVLHQYAMSYRSM